MAEPLIFVVRDATYGSAAMRGVQQVENLRDVGIEARAFGAEADRASLMALRDATVVLVKDAGVEDELVVALATAGNRLIWDAVDFLAHKPPLAGIETPVEHLKRYAMSEFVETALVMTESTGEIVRSAFRNVADVAVVDHQVDRAFLTPPALEEPAEFGLAYVGAPENVPKWAEVGPPIQYLSTADRPFPTLLADARKIPFHVDFRNPTRDRRDLKPWTKLATTVHLGAVAIVEANAANVGALGPDHPLLFDGTRIDFRRAVDDARTIWNEGRWADLRAGLEPLRERSHPHEVARRLGEIIGTTARARR